MKLTDFQTLTPIDYGWSGDREAVDEESKLRFGIGYDFSCRIKGFTYTPACRFKPALLIRHFVTPSPLGKASNEETYR